MWSRRKRTEKTARNTARGCGRGGSRVPLDEFTKIGQKFAAAGVQLTAYNLSFVDNFTDAEIRRGFEMARAMGVKVITASSTLSVVPRLAPVAKEFGMTVGLHNHSKVAPNQFATPTTSQRQPRACRI